MILSAPEPERIILELARLINHLVRQLLRVEGEVHARLHDLLREHDAIELRLLELFNNRLKLLLHVIELRLALCLDLADGLILGVFLRAFLTRALSALLTQARAGS